jgi:hypothetical protein
MDCCDESQLHDGCGDRSECDPDQPPPSQGPVGLCQCICGGAINDQGDLGVWPPTCNALNDAIDGTAINCLGAGDCRCMLCVPTVSPPPAGHLFILNLSMLL